MLDHTGRSSNHVLSTGWICSYSILYTTIYILLICNNSDCSIWPQKMFVKILFMSSSACVPLSSFGKTGVRFLTERRIRKAMKQSTNRERRDFTFTNVRPHEQLPSAPWFHVCQTATITVRKPLVSFHETNELRGYEKADKTTPSNTTRSGERLNEIGLQSWTRTNNKLMNSEFLISESWNPSMPAGCSWHAGMQHCNRVPQRRWGRGYLWVHCRLHVSSCFVVVVFIFTDIRGFCNYILLCRMWARCWLTIDSVFCVGDY